jgi:HK97 family phage prohead protease
MPSPERELRVWRSDDLEVRATEDGGDVLTAHAAAFMTYSRNLGGFVEQIDPVAFNDTLARGGNVIAVMNHDPNMLLGDTASGTLALSVDADGLRYDVQLDPSDPDAQRVMAKVKRKTLRGSSFAFRTLEDSWGQTEQGFPLRTLRAVELFDVGPVAMPAYPATEGAGLAVALRSLATHVGEPLERLVSAASENRLAEYLGVPKQDVDPGEQPSRPLLQKWAARYGVRLPAGS